MRDSARTTRNLETRPFEWRCHKPVWRVSLCACHARCPVPPSRVAGLFYADLSRHVGAAMFESQGCPGPAPSVLHASGGSASPARYGDAVIDGFDAGSKRRDRRETTGHIIACAVGSCAQSVPRDGGSALGSLWNPTGVGEERRRLRERCCAQSKLRKNP